MFLWVMLLHPKIGKKIFLKREWIAYENWPLTLPEASFDAFQEMSFNQWSQSISVIKQKEDIWQNNSINTFLNK